MKVSILRRIKAMEQQTKQTKTPDLIMIFFDNDLGVWTIREHYSRGKGNNLIFDIKEQLQPRLCDFCFPADFEGRVILNTFGNTDANIDENLFMFDAEDLRTGLKIGNSSGVYIEAIEDLDTRPAKAEFVVKYG